MAVCSEYKQLLEAFKEWIDFSSSLRDLEERTWNACLEPGKWTVRDIVCHIMLWDQYFYEEAIEKIASGEKITLKHLDFDEFNRKAIRYAKTINTDELVEKALYYRNKIIVAIESLPEDAVAQNYIDGDGSDFYIPQYLQDFIWHDQHHMEPMKEYIEAR